MIINREISTQIVDATSNFSIFVSKLSSMNTPKILKRIFIGIGIILLLLIGAAVLIPIVFKDKILTLAKTEINNNINATVDFKDLDLSIFKNFPTLTVTIDNIYVANKAPFLGDSLLNAKEIQISLDLMKVIKGSYEIKSVSLKAPRIQALVNEQGVSNWEITLPDTSTVTTAADTASYAVSLQEYSIEDAYIHYSDAVGKMDATITGLNHSGSGNFTSDLFTLKTKTAIDALTFIYGGIPYLSKVKTTADLDIDIDNNSSKYSFNTDNIRLNGLKLATKGFVQMPDTSHMMMDILFSTPSNDFKDILSLIPSVYAHDFEKIKTSGKAKLDGFVKGTYSTTQMPAWSVNLGVENGYFQYPDLPQAVKDIQIKMNAQSPDGNTDHTVVNLEKGHIVFGTAPFDMTLLLKTPISNPWVDAAGKGHLDLAQMQQFVKLEEGTKLTGLIDLDVAVKGYISAAQKQQYDQLDAKGTVGIKDLLYASKDYPDGVVLRSLLLSFNPKNVTVSDLNAQYLKTNFTGSGSIDNLLGYYLHNDALTGSLTVAADKIELNKWMGAVDTTQQTASGTTPAAEPFAVPANLNLALNASAGEVDYENLVMKNLKSQLEIKDQTVFLKSVNAEALKGTIALSGAYSTKIDKKNPDIQFGYKVQNVDIQQTFSTFNTVKQLMPVAKFLNGTFTSELTMTGKLDKEMNPVMNSITGDGSVLLLQGVLSSFAPLDKLASTLNVTKLQNLSLKDVKTWFSFADGRVTVKPFNIKVNDINMEVVGSHGFDQTLDYALNLTLPRSLMGSQGNALLNNLVSQANNKGLNLSVGETVNMAVKVGGTITKPTIGTSLKEVAGNIVNDVKNQIEAEAKARVETAKSAAKDSLNALKNDVKQSATNAATNAVKGYLSGNKDSTNNTNSVEETKKNVEQKAKGLINGLFKK